MRIRTIATTAAVAAALVIGAAQPAAAQTAGGPTLGSVIDGLRNLGTYKAADLTCQPLDISLKNFGKTPTKSCQYFVTFKNGKFVVMNNGKPIFGKIIGDPALIKANSTGTASAAPRTSLISCAITAIMPASESQEEMPVMRTLYRMVLCKQ